MAQLLLPLLSIVMHQLVSHSGVAEAKALFVFGDSFADTGNHDPNAQNISNQAWRPPYGSTFPGQPNGRFSNGFVLTDEISQILGFAKAPIPFRQITTPTRELTPADLALGINFAFAGSGVFETYGPDYPTTGQQVQHLQDLNNSGMYNRQFFSEAPVLYVLSGNDYNAYLLKNGSLEGILAFVASVNAQLQADLSSLIDLGFKNLMVTNLHPIGCVPSITAQTNFTNCSGEADFLIVEHNNLLNQTAASLETSRQVNVLILDHFQAFDNIIHNPEKFGIKEPLRPCCYAEAPHNCSDIDAGDVPWYTVCSEPETSFYWDNFHPTSAGWGKVTGFLFEHIKSFLAQQA